MNYIIELLSLIQDSNLSIVSIVFTVIYISIYSFFAYWILLYFGRFIFKRKNVKPAVILPKKRQVTFLVPIHTESCAIIRRCIESLDKLKYDQNLIVYLLVSPNTNHACVNRLVEDFNTKKRSFIVKNYQVESKGEKITLAIKDIITDYTAILDVDHTIDKNWITSSLEAMHAAGDHCIGCQGIRKMRGQKTFISLWDSFVNHICNEVINLLRLRSAINIPFTGTSALFKTDIFTKVPFKPHLTEDTYWFMRMRLHGKYFFTYQDKSATYELMPTSLRALIQRRIRWSTGHNHSYFSIAKLDNILDINLHLHGMFFLISGLLYLSLIFSALFLLLQGTIVYQIATCVLIVTLLRYKQHEILALIPIIIHLIAKGYIYFHFLAAGFPQSIFLSNKISLLFLLCMFLQLILYVCVGKKMQIFSRQYVLPIVFTPIFIVYELYCSFVGLFYVKNHQQTWNMYKKISYPHLAISIQVIFIVLFLHLDFTLLRLVTKNAYDYWYPSAPQLNSAVTIKDNQIFVDDQLYVMKGVSINAPLIEDDLFKISEAGFNTVRFYNIPKKSILKKAHKLGLKSIVQNGAANWNNTNLSSSINRIYFELKFLNTQKLIKKYPSILFQSIGNELEGWPMAARSSSTQWKKNKVNEISFYLNSIIRKYSSVGHVFSYSSFISGSTKLNLDDIPIVMINTNGYFARGWQLNLNKILHLNRPVIINEFGGNEPYRIDGSDYYMPRYINNYLAYNNYKEFLRYNLAGTFFFAFKDRKNTPQMFVYSDPFISRPADKIGILDRDGNYNSVYWMFVDLMSEFKVLRAKGGVYLQNMSGQAIQVQTINNSSFLTTLDNEQKLYIANQLLLKENFIEYIKNEKVYKRALFHADGYRFACKVNIDFAVTDLKNQKASIRYDADTFGSIYLQLESSVDEIEIKNKTGDLFRLRYLDGKNIVMYSKNHKGDLVIFSKNVDIPLEELKMYRLIPCNKKSYLTES